MFEAVIMGRSHPRLSSLSKRRAIRRLACRKRFAILRFTRNPPCFVEWVSASCPLYPRKQGRFRVFHAISAKGSLVQGLGKPPKGYANWSLRLLAEHVVELGLVESISHETIRQTLKKTG
jgi:hypothetical protein